MFKIYLAGGMSGLTWNEADTWRRDLAALLPEVRCLSPMRCKREKLKLREEKGNEGLLGDVIEDDPLLSRRGIFTRDFFDCTRADLVVVNLTDYTGKNLISIGTIFEIAWAWQARIPLVLILPSTLNKEINKHEHPFILEAADFRAENVEDAADIIKAIL